MTGQVLDGDRVKIILPVKGWIGVLAVVLGLAFTAGTLYYNLDKRIAVLENYRTNHSAEVDLRWDTLLRQHDEIKQAVDRLAERGQSR